MSGIGNNSPTNIGFLAYNWYNQCAWYAAAQGNDFHALSLLPVHFNFIYAITYLGGISSGNIVMGFTLWLGTIGLLVMNNITAWVSWATDLPKGDGIYQFFFFGWQTLDRCWRTFILLWTISDTIMAFIAAILGLVLTFGPIAMLKEESFTPSLYDIYRVVLYGSPTMLMFTWVLIMWVELIISRNNIESDTDMVAVYLFIAQVVLILLPDPLRIAMIVWRRVSAVVSALSLTLSWIISTLKRIPLAISNCWAQSTTANVLPKHGPSQELADIRLEEGTQQNSNVLPEHGSSEPSAVRLEEGAQQNPSGGS